MFNHFETTDAAIAHLRAKGFRMTGGSVWVSRDGWVSAIILIAPNSGDAACIMFRERTTQAR